MTENQRDYLADLAGRKGVRLSGTDEMSAAQASAEIERLKELPDAEFAEPTSAEDAEITKRTDAVLREMGRWGFTRGQK